MTQTIRAKDVVRVALEMRGDIKRLSRDKRETTDPLSQKKLLGMIEGLTDARFRLRTGGLLAGQRGV